jgi:hypothetical protein
MPRFENVNPRKTQVHNHRLNKDAVRYYESNPNGRYQGGGGNPIGFRQSDGSVYIVNGAHRRQAAINRGRRVRVKVYEQGERRPTVEDGCGLLVLAYLGVTAALGSTTGSAIWMWLA